MGERLVLFDIDGTLLRTHGAGVAAMATAARGAWGDHFDFGGIDTAGRLDPLIWADAARANGLDDPDEHHDRFRDLYAVSLRESFDGGRPVELLPGVDPLISALEAAGPAAVVGLLTGNYPETGRLKVQHAGLDPNRFLIAAWGCDGVHRRDLPAVAIGRYRERHGRDIDPAAIVIIGDTPNDIDCAHHSGCRCIAVATGKFTSDDLLGADLVVPDLTDTEMLFQWIMST